MKGPVYYVCFCGARNPIYEYVEFIDCYACNQRITFNESIKAHYRKEFPKGVTYRQIEEKDSFEERILKSLDLSESDKKYISVTEDMVYFIFPLRIDLDLSVGGKELRLDKKALKGVYENIIESFEQPEMSNNGFENNTHLNIGDDAPILGFRGELEFCRAISSEEEAREAVRYLVGLKQRFDF